jgi:alkylhydroperoxidase family enzyme
MIGLPVLLPRTGRPAKGGPALLFIAVAYHATKSIAEHGMSTRIEPAQEPFSEAVQGWLRKTMPPGRAPLALFTTLARDERLFERFFSGGLLDRGHLRLRQRELVIDRTTALNRCEYEWGVHIAFFGERVGLTPTQVRSLVTGSPSDECWSQDDRLLLRLCDELHDSATVSDELWEALRQRHSEEAMLELLLLAGFYRTVSYLCNAVRLPLESDAARFPREGAEGGA